MRSLTKRRNPQRLRRLPRFTRETKQNNAFASFCMVVKSILVAQMREVGFLVPKFFMSSLTMTNTFTVQRKPIAVHGYRLASHVPSASPSIPVKIEKRPTIRFRGRQGFCLKSLRTYVRGHLGIKLLHRSHDLELCACPLQVLPGSMDTEVGISLQIISKEPNT